MTEEFVPVNEFEAELLKAKQGISPMQAFLRIFVSSEISVPSGTEVMEDGSGFTPLLFLKDNVQMLACFSEKRRIGSFAAMAPYCLVIKGGDLLRRIPPEYGLVINPGQQVGFEISPEGITKIVRDFVK
jgi:hypothetical protein